MERFRSAKIRIIQGALSMTRAGTDRLARHVAALLAEYIHAIIHKEMKPMVDAVSDLTAATDSALSVIGELLAEVQKDVAALAVLPKDNTAALEVQIERLKTGTDAAAAA